MTSKSVAAPTQFASVVETLPPHWRKARLKNWANINAEMLPETTDPNYRFNYIEIGSVSNGSLTDETKHIAFRDAPSRARRVVCQGDTIVSTVRTYLKAVWFAETAADLVCSTGFAVLSPKPNTAPKFAAYLALSDLFIQAVVADSVGIGYPAIPETKFGDIEVPVPPPEEQAAIVRYLDHADDLINRYISAKERLIALLEEQRQTAIHQAVTRGLDLSVPLKQTEIPWAEELPHDWQTAHLRYITTCLDGARRPVSAELRANMQGGIPYWGANSVIDHVNDWLFDEPLVLVGEDGAPFFEPYRDVSFFVHGRIWPNNHIHVLRCTTHVSPRFLTHVLNCVDYTNYISGSTRDKLTQQALGSIPIQLPPLEVQDSIVDFLDRALNTIDSTISSASRQISLMNEYRTRLIADVVTGQLDVRDAAIRIPD